MSSSDNEIPLLERAELPQFMEIPKEARQPLTVLERDFVSAEVELSELLIYLFWILSFACDTIGVVARYCWDMRGARVNV